LNEAARQINGSNHVFQLEKKCIVVEKGVYSATGLRDGRPMHLGRNFVGPIF
jgi:hypothetical protein